MRICGVRMVKDDLEDEPRPLVKLELEVYEIRELINDTETMIERGASVGRMRQLIDRHDTLRRALVPANKQGRPAK